MMNSRKIIIGFVSLVLTIQVGNAQSSSTTGALTGGNTLNAIIREQAQWVSVVLQQVLI